MKPRRRAERWLLLCLVLSQIGRGYLLAAAEEWRVMEAVLLAGWRGDDKQHKVDRRVLGRSSRGNWAAKLLHINEN